MKHRIVALCLAILPLIACDKKPAAPVRESRATADGGAPLPPLPAALLADAGDPNALIVAIQRKTSDPAGYAQLAIAQLQRGRPDEAIDSCQHGLGVAPADARLRCVLGWAWLEKRTWVYAKAQLSECVKTSNDAALRDASKDALAFVEKALR